MDIFSFVLAILVVTIVLPLWLLFHFISRWRAQRGLSAQDERLLAELWDTANRMEGRIQALERILDAEAPGWRNKH